MTTAAHAFASQGSFAHGVHPAQNKGATEARPIERMPFVEEYVLPLSQHIGAPSQCLVRPGQRVQRGEQIAAPVGFVSTALHAPVAGTVKAVEPRPHPGGKRLPAIVLQADAYASQREVVSAPRGDEAEPAAALLARIQNAGIVGLGGAAFPSHVKFEVPPDKPVRAVVLNGCECEPYLTCDHRVMVEQPGAVLRGLEIVMRLVGAAEGYVGVEVNKPDAIEALRRAASDSPHVRVVPLTVKYPEGAEKMLIDAVFDTRVPSGKLPLDVGVICNNVATSAAIADLFDHGLPLIERVVTVTGPGVRRPSNLLVPIGTPLAAVIDHCGGLRDDVHQIVLGGPMMGMPQKDPDVPVLKGTSGVIALTEHARRPREEPCIRCGRCLEACPLFLDPSRLAALVRNERPDDLEAHHMLDCFECASCSYVCPSHIPLVQLMRVGKGMVRQRRGGP